MCDSFDRGSDLTRLNGTRLSFAHKRATPESKWSELVGSMHVMHAAMASVRPRSTNCHQRMIIVGDDLGMPSAGHPIMRL